jgi:hypothetical protein
MLPFSFSAVWKSILLGQLISLLLCTMSVLCQILVENYNIKIPAGQLIIENQQQNSSTPLKIEK